MSNVGNVGNVGNTSPVQRVTSAPIQKSLSADAPVQQKAVDRLDLSGLGYLQALKSNGVRTEKVAAIKAQIEAGTYESDHKLDVATDRLLDDIQK